MSVGIKIKWTLEDEENWNATHRLAGRVWVSGAIGIFASVFLPKTVAAFVMIGVMLVIVLVPIIYSYCFYKKKNGK